MRLTSSVANVQLFAISDYSQTRCFIYNIYIEPTCMMFFFLLASLSSLAFCVYLSPFSGYLLTPLVLPQFCLIILLANTSMCLYNNRSLRKHVMRVLVLQLRDDYQVQLLDTREMRIGSSAGRCRRFSKNYTDYRSPVYFLEARFTRASMKQASP